MGHYETRLRAAAAGYTRYYTGRPCAQGHDSERYVSSGACIECMRERDRQRYAEIQRLRRQADAQETST